MLQVKNLSKTYISKKKIKTLALDNVSCHFDFGETVAVFGPSGSGKTTLLNVLSGIDTPDEGSEIYVDGISTETFKEKNWDNYRNYKVGYVFQDNCLVEHLTAWENVAMGLAFSGQNVKIRKKLAWDALSKVGLEGLERKYPNELSGGQLQCVSIARAIVKNPDIVLADEPTGSLDTKQSIKIIELLKNVCKDKLLIFASHNEKLVKKFANKIYLIEDGKVTMKSESSDYVQNTNVILKENDKSSSTIILEDNKVKTKKSKLSLIIGFWAALKNFRYHKIKSFLMFFAGSIGVIVVSVVLAFSNGINTRIQDLQNTTFAQYPVTFGSQRDMTKVASSVKAIAESQAKEKTEYEIQMQKRERAYQEARENNRVALNNTIGSMLSTKGDSPTENHASTVNDLASLKKYLDTNPDNFNDKTLDVEYVYRTSPVIYLDNVNGTEEVYPLNSMFGSVGTNSGSKSLTGTSKKAGNSSAYSFEKSFQNIGPLPASEELYRDDDCLVAGHWPQNPFEAILVLNSDATIDDTLLYYLGLRDFNSEIAPLLEKYKNHEAVEFPGQFDTYAYSDFLNAKFKMINPSDCYAQQNGIWVDMSSDTEYMKSLLANARDITVVGVVLPVDGSRSYTYLNTGVQFSHDLFKISIEETTNSPIVQAQLSNPDVDVLTGLPFTYLEQSKSVAEKIGNKRLINFNLDMLLSSIKFNPEALDLKMPKNKAKELNITDKEILKMLDQILNDEVFQEFIHDITKEGHFDEYTFYACVYATQQYLHYKEEAGEHALSPDIWFQTHEGKEVVSHIAAILPEALVADVTEFLEKYAPIFIANMLNELTTEIVSFLDELFTVLMDDSGPDLIEFDEAKFSQAIGINITWEEVNQLLLYMTGATEHTYKGNLADFGYDDLSDPVSITIYPKDYQSKTEIITIIENYNTDVMNQNQEAKFVTYNDDASSVVNATQSVVTLVSSVLVYFLSSIFVSSTLLIGLIFGLSTLSRRREVGIMRVLGARRRDISRLFNCESFMIGALSGVVGVVVALILCSVINNVTKAGFTIVILPFGAAVALILISALLILIACLIPSKIASKKDPVKAIRGW